MAKALLVSYPGYPYTPSSLLPDNGLANLAGALIEAGHEVLVLAYGTVDTMRRLFPQPLRPKLCEVYNQVRSEGSSRLTKLYSLFRLRVLDRQLAQHRMQETRRIAAEMAETARKEVSFRHACMK